MAGWAPEVEADVARVAAVAPVLSVVEIQPGEPLPPTPEDGCLLAVQGLGDDGWLIRARGDCGTGTPRAWRLDPVGRRTTAVPWLLDPSEPLARAPEPDLPLSIPPLPTDKRAFRVGQGLVLGGAASSVASFALLAQATHCSPECWDCGPPPIDCGSPAVAVARTSGVALAVVSPLVGAVGAAVGATAVHRDPRDWVIAGLPGMLAGPIAGLLYQQTRSGADLGVETEAFLGPVLVGIAGQVFSARQAWVNQSFRDAR